MPRACQASARSEVSRIIPVCMERAPPRTPPRCAGRGVVSIRVSSASSKDHNIAPARRHDAEALASPLPAKRGGVRGGVSYFAIPAPPEKFEIALIAKHLKLLPDFLADMSVHWIEATETSFEGIDVIEREMGCANVLDAFEDV